MLAKQNEQCLTTDVIVAGAGAAGIPAAIAAARAGAKVILLEEDLSIGGAPVDNYVCMPCGWPTMGIYKELIGKLQAGFSLNDTGLQPDGGRHGIWYLPSSYEYVLRGMLEAEENIKVMTGCKVSGVLTEDAAGKTAVRGVSINSHGKKATEIKAKITIDATGNGDVAYLAGCEVMSGIESKNEFEEPNAPADSGKDVMPCTMMYITHKFNDKNGLDFNRLQHTGFIESGYGWHTKANSDVYKRATGLYLHWGATALCEDVNSQLKLAETQSKIFQMLRKDFDMLSENGYAVYLPPKIGIRESRRIKGEHIITENDLRSEKYPLDTIAIGKYWLDLWGGNITGAAKKLPPHAITYRSIIPIGFDGLLTAGRCISGTHIAMSAYRVQPVVAQIGQAAGTAAAMAAKKNIDLRDVDIKKLRKTLIQEGIELDKYLGKG